MEATAMDLLVAFSAATVFTCSDEITMIFPPLQREPRAGSDEVGPQFAEASFGGKVQKLASVTAGYASVSFDRHMRDQHFDPATEADLIEHVKTKRPYFDGRVFNVPSNTEIVNNVVWRSHYDFRRNSVSMLGRAHFSAAALNKKSTQQVIAMLKQDKNVDWHALPDRYKYGSYIKKQRFVKTVQLPQKNDATADHSVDAVRSKPVAVSMDIHKYTPEFERFLCSKYLPDPAFDDAPQSSSSS
eukprot:TRINITY_DN3751_c0_g1_i1.p1 TRINITY_DN3751_c0_g1~~TRINITY_DN3751_c0_g1_i1.p1  ORF type:complete len:243 (-),score=50.20 TRINITY_DN3751_c0_g1_i1:533-1261(-)